MSGSGRLSVDPLFQGLARPPMIMGVSYMFFVFNALINLVGFIQAGNFILILFLAPIVHLVGFIICLKEPRQIELIILRTSKGTKCRNRIFHGFTNSYDAF